MSFTKIITIPQTSESMQKMQGDINFKDFQLNFYFSDKEFYDLWDNSIFEKINEVCDSLIDDFEDESILDLDLIQQSIGELLKMQFKSDFSSKNRYKLVSILQKALEYNTGVFFFF